MPLFGTRDISTVMADAPLMAEFKTEPLALPGAGILQVMFEIRESEIVSLIPPSLHPTIPPVVAFVITHVPESPAGPFTMAECRVGCRAGARPRGYNARIFVDTPAAAELLRGRWGYPAHLAEVKLRPGYDRVHATVASGGETILDVSLQDPEAISGGDVQYLPAMNLARTMRDGAEVCRILQVDAEFVFRKADRGKPHLVAFDAGAWNLPGAKPWWGVSASYAVADMELPALRYALDPVLPAIQGLEKLG